ncbi:hypothetical protein P3T42_000995 [Paraburkholderia sp. GAS38]
MTVKIKVIHTHASGTPTNFGVQEFGFEPVAGQRITLTSGKRYLVTAVQSSNDGPTTIYVKDDA